MTRVELRVDRVPRGQAPVFETHLGEAQRIVGVDHYFTVDSPRRETVDHIAMCWVVWDPGVAGGLEREGT